MAKIKELTPTQSAKAVQSLFKNKVQLTSKNFVPGTLLFYFYDAKDKVQTYDRTPLVLILKRNSVHTLAINFHWLPLPMRIVLVKMIISSNADNIKNNKPLDFKYEKLKPLLKKLGYSPCIRLYINNRISSKGVIIPAGGLMDAAKLKSETFTNGKYSAEELYRRALKNNKIYRSSR